MLNNKIVYVLLALLLISSVNAVYFDADLVAVKNKITIDQIAEFRLTIYNHEDSFQVFKVKNKNYPSWDIRTNPIANPVLVEVPPNSSQSVILLIDPNAKYVGDSGSHFVNLDIISQSSGESLAKQARVGIVASDDIISGYVPTVMISTDFSPKLNPGESSDFKITLSNQNKLDITKATIILSSSLISKEAEVNIPPKGETVVDVKPLLDPKTKPMKDTLTITLMYNGKKVAEVIKNYEVVPYSTLAEDSVEEKSFLRHSESIIFTNKGNVKSTYDIKVATSFIKRFFGSTKPEAIVKKEDGAYNYVWKIELDPFESYTVKITENYLGVLILVVALLLIALLIFLKRSPIVIKKEVTDTESNEGGLSKMKVLINVRNRSNKKVKELSIVDKIPKLLEIDKETILGSLKPSKIKRNPKQETLILWSLEELVPGEERVITYHLKSNLNILGGLTLQPAVVKFRDKDKEIKVRSNITFVRV